MSMGQEEEGTTKGPSPGPGPQPHLLPRYQVLSWFGEKGIGLCVLKEGFEVQWTLTFNEHHREMSSIIR